MRARSPRWWRTFHDLAEQHDLLITGGSDYHGQAKPGITPGMDGLTWPEWETLAARCGWPSSGEFAPA
jgi:hypothetical protein